MLEERSRALLKTLIEKYIQDGQPVGSRTLSTFFDLSPATIRHIMADLENIGLIASPHTSAGRVPTPRGYRLFVDTLLTVKPFEQEAAQALRQRLPTTEPQQMIGAAAQLLSQMTQFAGVVLTPKRSQSFRHIEFVKLSEKRVLLIIVTPAGDVQNRILLVDHDYGASELTQAANFLNSRYAGRDFDDVLKSLRNELSQLRDDMASLMAVAVQAGSDAAQSGEEVLVAGERNFLDLDDMASNTQRLRQLFDLFERKSVLLQLLALSSRAEGVQIFIGGDSQWVPHDDLTVVTAPYEVDGKIVGTLGVVGPTRMAYERVIPLVDITAKILSNALKDVDRA